MEKMVNAMKNKNNREYHESLRDYTTEEAIVVVKKKSYASH